VTTSRVRVPQEAGFTLVELLVSLLLMILGLLIAAQLLGETQQMFLDATRESLDPAGALIATRLRVDVLGASEAVAAQNADHSCDYLRLSGNSQGTIVYRLAEGDLVRSVLAADGTEVSTAVLLHDTKAFACQTIDTMGPSMVLLDYQYLRNKTRRSPLALMPSAWGASHELARESFLLTPRGAGLGNSW
jgi:Tfp pilus assembly protein PilV